MLDLEMLDIPLPQTTPRFIFCRMNSSQDNRILLAAAAESWALGTSGWHTTTATHSKLRGSTCEQFAALHTLVSERVVS